jgi:hypothetical protein
MLALSFLHKLLTFSATNNWNDAKVVGSAGSYLLLKAVRPAVTIRLERQELLCQRLENNYRPFRTLQVRNAHVQTVRPRTIVLHNQHHY